MLREWRQIGAGTYPNATGSWAEAGSNGATPRLQLHGTASAMVRRRGCNFTGRRATDATLRLQLHGTASGLCRDPPHGRDEPAEMGGGGGLCSNPRLEALIPCGNILYS